MAFIRFGKIDKNLIPILVGCVFSFFTRLLFTYKGTTLFNHLILSNLIGNISKLFTIIPFLIIIYKHHKAKKELGKKEKNLFHRESKKEIIKGKWKYILLSGIIYFIQGTILFFTIEVKTNLYIWDILITCIFSYLILKIKLFRHHYLSITLIILIGIILDLATGNLQQDISNNWKKILLRFTREIIFSLHDIINKYAMEIKFCKLYEISFYTGLITIILFGLFSMLDYFFFNLDNFGEYFKDFNFTELLLIFGYIFAQLGLYLGILFTNKDNTPCHIFIIYIFGQIAYYVVDFSGNSIIVIICLVFILFLSLIFNEIIEINFLGLSDNTKRNISERAALENFIPEKNEENKINLNDHIFIELNEEEDVKDDEKTE